MSEPNRDNIRLWVDDLRTTDAEQGKGELRYVPSDGAPAQFCCLGRACEVAIANGAALRRRSGRGGYQSDGPDGVAVPVNGTLPPIVRQWLGFTDNESDPVIASDKGKAIYATEANDVINWTFDQIADAIETRYLTPAPDDSATDTTETDR